MKPYATILRNNDPLKIDLPDGGFVIISTYGNTFEGQMAKQLWNEVTKDRLKNHELLQRLDEEGHIDFDFCEVCHKPINKGEEICSECRASEILNEIEE